MSTILDKPLYQYTFTTYRKIGNPVTIKILAHCNLYAMKIYCASERIQDLSMDEIHSILISHKLMDTPA